MLLKLPAFLQSSRQRERLVLAWAGNELAYVLAREATDGRHQVLRLGVMQQGDEPPEVFSKRLAALNLRGQAASAMLRPSQYQVLQIEAPSVPPEELRTAARWQIREMVNMHVDDLTLDVLKVGDEQVRATGNLFVVAAANAVIRDVMDMGQALRRPVQLIDIQDLAVRNLQSALVRRLGVAAGRAHAAVVVSGDESALLTICANDELFYTRRIDLDPGFMQARWGQSEDAAAPQALSLDAGADLDRAQRLVVEIHRSLDLWDRTWPMLVLDRLFVHAGARTGEMVRWLGQETSQTVMPLDVADLFPGFEQGSEEERQRCWPLLGVLLRDEGRTR